MKSTIRYISMFLATLMVLTSFTFIALAEGESSDPVADSSSSVESSTPSGGESSTPSGGESSTPSGGESSTPSGGESSTPSGGESSTPSGGESSTPSGGESSTPSGGESSTPSGGESSNPGGDDPKPADKYTIKVICSEPSGLSDVLIGGTSVSAGGSVSLNGEVFINVIAKDGFYIQRAVLMAADEEIAELDGTPDGTAEATLVNLINGVTYSLEIVLAPAFVGETDVNISTTDGDSGKLLGYDVTVNGVSKGSDIANLIVKSGEKVVISLKTAETFDKKRCLFYFNGNYVSSEMKGNSYEFIAAENTVNIKIYYYFAPVKFTLNGPSTVRVYYYDNTEVATITNTTAGRMDQTVNLQIYDRDGGESNVPCYFFKSYVVEGGAYELNGTPSVSGGSGDHWKIGSARYFVVDGLLTITQNVKEVDVPIAPTEHTITVIVGDGGSVTAVRKSDGKTFTFDKKNKTVKLIAGDSLDFTITADDGYFIDTVYNNDESVSLTDGTLYSLIGIIKDHRIDVQFISEEELLKNGIGEDDVDWDAENIVINVTNETPVLPEVFERIQNLSGDGKFVEFKSANGSIYIPYGEKSVVGASTNMAISVIEDAPDDLVKLLAEGSSYKVVSISAGAIFPQGTKISVNLGKEFARKDIMLYEYKSSSLDSKEFLKVNSDGVSDKYSYNSQSTLVFANRQFNVEITSNGGGAITPFGNLVYIDGTKMRISVEASEGYYIKSISVNGVLKEIDENEEKQIVALSITSDHAVDVKFALKENAPADESSKADDSSASDGNEDEGGFNPVPVLIIAFVAVAGAAALFIVKWKQEKF